MPFQDVDEPVDRLADPEEPAASLGDRYVDLMSFFSMLSPAAWINEVFKDVLGRDPIGEVTKQLAGDWAAFHKCGQALDHLAGALQAMATNISVGAAELDATWDGNAADAAWTYFTRLGVAVSDQQPALHRLSREYQDAARGIWEVAQVAGNLIQDMIDTAITIGLAAAAGSLLAETGVGALFGWGLAAMKTVELLELWGKVTKLLARASYAAEGLAGFTMQVIEDGGLLDRFPLPEPYRHPVVS